MNDPRSKITTFVIFGATGDLTQRKLIPALFNLHRKKRLPGQCRIVGFSRSDLSDDVFRDRMRKAVDTFGDYSFEEKEWQVFRKNLHYVRGKFDAAKDFDRLAADLEPPEGQNNNILFYLASPPQLFPKIVDNLCDCGLVKEHQGWRRVIIEKPFGRDLSSAMELDELVHRSLKESQIYRIDHYLGKETVQNVLVLRFANSIYEPVWNRNYIDHVQITVAEQVGLEFRAAFYDKVGVVRDIFQNHIFQLLTLVAMEPPSAFEATALHNEKTKVLKAVRPIAADELDEHTVRGQYRGYLDEEGVAPGSTTATYAALRFYIDNWRWQGVPFYLRSGKKLQRKSSEIIIQYKEPPHVMFPIDHGIPPNRLALCLQPDEGIHSTFEVKVPGTAAEMRTVPMDFNYADSFDQGSIPEAYERLLLDAAIGDSSLFIRTDQIELSWELVDPIINGWRETGKPDLAIYDPGTWGPSEAEQFMELRGRNWMVECGAS